MKKKILLVFSAILVLGLVFAAYALNKPNNAKTAMADCCSKSDSCPMKNKDAKTSADNQTDASCCDKEDCCCKGDSCPMKAQGENASASCCACCGDSCPMKNENAQATGVDMKNVTVAGGESCCQKGVSCCSGGACCKGKKG